MSQSFNRRSFLQIAGVSAAAVAAGISAPANAQSSSLSSSLSSHPGPAGGEDLFGLGVAAGSPRHDSMILWTRLAPDPLADDGHGGMTGGDVTVRWEVATDGDFRDIVKRGEALAQRELAHSVHPQVDGLEPATEYFYRFEVEGNVSPVGRFKTLPAPGADVDKFTLSLIHI